MSDPTSLEQQNIDAGFGAAVQQAFSVLLSGLIDPDAGIREQAGERFASALTLARQARELALQKSAGAPSGDVTATRSVTSRARKKG